MGERGLSGLHSSKVDASISNLRKFTAVNYAPRTWHGGNRRRVRRRPPAREGPESRSNSGSFVQGINTPTQKAP
jgi:hypothetical protein